MIWFLNAKNLNADEIHWQFCGVYVPSEGKVQQWVRQFKDARTNVHDEDCSGCPSIVNDDLVDKGNTKFVKIGGS